MNAPIAHAASLIAVDPDLSLVPASLVNQGARDGVRDAIRALSPRAEGRRAAR